MSGSEVGPDIQMSISTYAERPVVAGSGRSGDETHPWLPNGDLRPTAASRHSLPPMFGVENEAD